VRKARQQGGEIGHAVILADAARAPASLPLKKKLGSA
jgi:hypothetical protein